MSSAMRWWRRTRGPLAAVVAVLVPVMAVAHLAATPRPVAVRTTSHTSTIAPAADAYTQQSAAGVNTGTQPVWMTDGRPGGAERAYLKFVVPAPPTGSTITHLMLSALVQQDAVASPTGLTVYRTGSKWAGRTLTWADQPALQDRLAGTNPSYVAGDRVRWDLTDALTPSEQTHGGTLSLAVTTEEQQQIAFASAESRHRPQLKVTTTQGAWPVPDPSTEAAVVHGWGAPIAGDEFSYTGAPDPSLWNTYDSPGQDGKGIRSPAAWHVDGNVVTVSGDAQGTTGGMAALFGRQTYGRWEVRMRTSARDPEYHPVLLLWPDSASSGQCPEVDYGEGSGDTTKVSFFLHYGCDSQQSYARRSLDTTQWHNYAVDWSPTSITGYVDGKQWFKDTNPAHQPPGSMHQTVQLDWFPDGSTTTPSWMQVDWVRVYAPPVTFPLAVRGRF